MRGTSVALSMAVCSPIVFWSWGESSAAARSTASWVLVIFGSAADQRAACRCSTRRIRWNTAPSSPSTGSRVGPSSRKARCCTAPE